MNVARIAATPLFLVTLAACSSSSNDAPAAPATGTDAGTNGEPAANAPDGPGITGKNCPLTPTGLNLVNVAPVWNGLVVLEANVPGGAPNSFDVQVLDPGSNQWVQSYAPLRQKIDGTYVVLLSPAITEASKGKAFKARIRSRLDGCPPSGWAESATFTLTDPIAGTTWVATIPSGLVNQSFFVNHTGTGTTVGPYVLSDAGVVHTMTFNADGSYAETMSYGIKSQSSTPGDLYDGCAIQLSFVGTWTLRTDGGTPTVLVSTRKPKPGAATTGSTCTAPPISEWDISQAGSSIVVNNTALYLGIDYSPLLNDPPGKPSWSAGDLGNALTNTLGALSDQQGPNTSSVGGSLYPQNFRYLKQ